VAIQFEYCFSIIGLCIDIYGYGMQGRIQDFKLGGAHLKKLRRAEGGANIFGVFRVKNHDFTPQKIIFFPILGGTRAGCAPPPESAPGML
jgi:hypothetical protein